MDMKLFENGMNKYEVANASETRRCLETSADLFMESEKNYDEFKSFMMNAFLEWMRSRNNSDRFIDMVEKDELKPIYKKIKAAHSIDELNLCLYDLVSFRGVGPVNASAIITLLRPKEYGIVNEYVVKALLKYEKLKIKKHSNISLNTVSLIEEEYIHICNNLNKNRNKDLAVFPRDLDKALWGLGKTLSK